MNERICAKPRENAVRREAQSQLLFFSDQNSRELDLNILKYSMSYGTFQILIPMSVPQLLGRDVGW